MLVIPNKPIVFFDIDNTLVFSLSEFPNLWHLRYIVHGGLRWGIHKEHVALLKDFAARGHTVIVWSAGGSKWASDVVKALGLKNFVYACMPKPFWYVDDKQCNEFMDLSKHIYVNKSYLDKKH